MNSTWQKSAHSGYNGNCLEARQVGVVQVRDSKLSDSSPVLAFSGDQWTRFLTSLTST